jgi:NTE family protein
MSTRLATTDLVLGGGGVLGIGHVGVFSVLDEHGVRIERVAGTSAGAIVGSLVAAGMPAARLHELMGEIDYRRALDKGGIDRVPLVGPPLSILLENGYAEVDYVAGLVERELAALGVRTFGDLRRDDPGADPRDEHRWRLTVMAADVTRGQLLRLPQDYARYGLAPDEQPVAAAVRASMAVPYLFEPYVLRHPEGESLLVDGGVITNYPIDAFDRTDGRPARWPTTGVTLIPQLPAGATRLLPQLAPLRLIPSYRFLESLIVTTIVGRDQGYLAQPWVSERSIEVETLGVSPFDFGITDAQATALYESGRRAATAFLERGSPNAPGG